LVHGMGGAVRAAAVGAHGVPAEPGAQCRRVWPLLSPRPPALPFSLPLTPSLPRLHVSVITSLDHGLLSPLSHTPSALSYTLHSLLSLTPLYRAGDTQPHPLHPTPDTLHSPHSRAGDIKIHVYPVESVCAWVCVCVCVCVCVYVYVCVFRMRHPVIGLHARLGDACRSGTGECVSE